MVGQGAAPKPLNLPEACTIHGMSRAQAKVCREPCKDGLAHPGIWALTITARPEVLGFKASMAVDCQVSGLAVSVLSQRMLDTMVRRDFHNYRHGLRVRPCGFACACLDVAGKGLNAQGEAEKQHANSRSIYTTYLGTVVARTGHHELIMIPDYGPRTDAVSTFLKVQMNHRIGAIASLLKIPIWYMGLKPFESE